MAKQGKTAVTMYYSNDYRAIIRAIQVLPMFDRIMLGVTTGAPFGTVSRVVSELLNEGYLQPLLDDTGRVRKATYKKAQLKRNPDLCGRPLNYSKNQFGEAGSEQLEKSTTWSEFMTRWRGFVVEQRNKIKLRERGELTSFHPRGEQPEPTQQLPDELLEIP